MLAARVEVRREALLRVGDTIPYYRHMAVVEEISENYLVVSYQGEMHTITWETLAVNFGASFTLDVEVHEIKL